MTYEESKGKFVKAAKNLIKKVWIKRVNPMHPEAAQIYPGAVTEMIEMTIDGESLVFFIRISSHSEDELNLLVESGIYSQPDTLFAWYINCER